MATMRAKMRAYSVEKQYADDDPTKINDIFLRFYAVGLNQSYPENGSDENNTFALWTPGANLEMSITNPALFNSFEPGDEFYLDFTKASKED